MDATRPEESTSREWIPMPDITDLAAGSINGHDWLHVELIQPIDSPAFIAVNWPAAATLATPATYPG